MSYTLRGNTSVPFSRSLYRSKRDATQSHDAGPKSGRRAEGLPHEPLAIELLGVTTPKKRAAPAGGPFLSLFSRVKNQLQASVYRRTIKIARGFALLRDGYVLVSNSNVARFGGLEHLRYPRACVMFVCSSRRRAGKVIRMKLHNVRGESCSLSCDLDVDVSQIDSQLRLRR